MVAWNRNCKIRSQGCFFVSPRWGNLTKRVLNAIGPLSWTRLFPLLGKAHPKWWHETEISGGLFQAAEKAGLTKVVELRSKRVFSTFPIGEKRKNTLGIEFYNFGFLPPFWVGFSKQRKKPGSRRSSNCVLNAFFELSHSAAVLTHFERRSSSLVRTPSSWRAGRGAPRLRRPWRR